MLNFEDVKKAKKRIEKYVYHTPLERSINLSDEDTNIYLKLENQQKLKCAKIRGAFSKITSLNEEEIQRGIVATSSGNHGASVCYASRLLGLTSPKIYVPENTPNSKVEKMIYYGGDVEKLGKNYDETHILSEKEIRESGRIFIDPSSDPVVLAGQGTIAMEILEEQPDIDTILVPIGGGGIFTGISVAAKGIKKDIKMIGVQTAACPAMVAALRDKKFYETYPSEESLCGALVGGVGKLPYEMADEYIDDIIVVEEEDIKIAVKFLMENEKTIAEPSGAVGVAAIMNNRERFKGKNVAVVLTGGNIDKETVAQILCNNKKRGNENEKV